MGVLKLINTAGAANAVAVDPSNLLLYVGETVALSGTQTGGYRMQEIAQGGLSKVTQRRLMTLANQLETDGRIAPLPGPRIKSGSRLIREWHGRTHTVTTIDEGFEFQGKTYRSLTQIAFEITGAKWSGPRFFGLTQRPRSAAGDRKTAASKAESDGVGTNADNRAFESENLHG